MDSSKIQFIGIIPARYASTRFPGKPLAMIGKKTMIQRVYEQAKKSQILNNVIVATDDSKIENHVKEFGNVVMTGTNHKSGTERCGEVAEKLISENLLSPEDTIINIQGDEPFINPSQIDTLAGILNNNFANIATLAKKIDCTEMLFDNNCVKVIMNKYSKAVYFSRAPIPYFQNTEKEKWLNKTDYFCHVGIYGYKIKTLLKLIRLSPAEIEKAESLEQLRWIYNEFAINVGVTEYESYAVDIKEDIGKIPKNLY